MKTSFLHQRTYTRSSGLKDTFGDFICKQCGSFVSAAALLAGVQNRNHCPYCLSSRHLDLFEAGDRLSACKGVMSAIALTWKRSPKKYASLHDGELMLVHCCQECGGLSINRIAADDDTSALLALLDTVLSLDPQLVTACDAHGIELLDVEDEGLVRRCLFGDG